MSGEVEVQAEWKVVDIDEANLETVQCCGVKNPKHAGRQRKMCWMQEHFADGLKAKVLLTPEGRQCGYIEYLPGEHAWRGVRAQGYLFIHCVWTYSKKIQRKGAATSLVEACVEEARKKRMSGVAVVARNQPWLAGSQLFRKLGFECVDSAPPDYELMVRKLKRGAELPKFNGGWEERLKQYGKGLTIVRSDQCPHVAKFADEIAAAAEEEFGVKPRIVNLKSAEEAQNAPTPYAVFSVIRDGKVLADHQISRTRFRNIMWKSAGAAKRT